MTILDWVGHTLLFLGSGFTYWVMQAGRHNIGTVLTITLPIVGVYFLGWWALLTFFLGIFYAARIYTKAIQAGKNPFKNPWRED